MRKWNNYGVFSVRIFIWKNCSQTVNLQRSAVLYQTSSSKWHVSNCSGGNNLSASEFKLEPSATEMVHVSTCWQANTVSFAIQLPVPFIFYLGFYHSYLPSLVPLCSLCTHFSLGVSLLHWASLWENEILCPYKCATFGLWLSIPEKEILSKWCFIFGPSGPMAILGWAYKPKKEKKKAYCVPICHQKNF